MTLEDKVIFWRFCVKMVGEIKKKWGSVDILTENHYLCGQRSNNNGFQRSTGTCEATEMGGGRGWGNR